LINKIFNDVKLRFSKFAKSFSEVFIVEKKDQFTQNGGEEGFIFGYDKIKFNFFGRK